MQTIQLDDKGDRWRFVCPRGHTSWEPTNGHFWCHACACAATATDADVDPTFDELRDNRDDSLLSRDEVRLLTEAGPYASLKTDAGV